MDSLSPQEVILNGDSSAPTRVVEGVLQPVAPTTAESKLARMNELKAMVLCSWLCDAIDVDDLEEMDLKWQMAMKGHFVREFRSPKDSKRNGAAKPHRRNVLVETSTSNALVSQCDGVGSYDWSFQVEEEPANYALMDFSYSSSYYDNESDESWPLSSLYDRFQPSDVYHDVPPPYIGTFMPPKPDLVFNIAPTDVETDHPAFTVKLSPTKHSKDLSLTNRPSAPIFEDWISDFEDESETKHVKTSIPVATPKPASPKPTSYGKRRNRNACFVCKSLDHLIKDCDYHATKMAQPISRNHAHRGKIRMETQMPSFRPCFPQHKCINDPKKGNPQHALKDKGVIDSGCSRHMT
nr:hypothetical protein [Tanacetum cinerariifolium]